MHNVFLQSADDVAAVAAALPSRDGVSCVQNANGTWTLRVPNELTAAADAAAAAPITPRVQVPQFVTRAQAKIQLHRAALLDEVKTAVAADPEVQLWFDEASLWYRDNPHVIALGETIAGGAAGIDALFIAANQIAA